MGFFRGKQNGLHADLDLMTPYERYKKETQSPSKVYMKRSLFSIFIVLSILFVNFAFFVPKHGVRSVFIGISIAFFWGFSSCGKKGKIIKKQEERIASWENRPIPVEDKREVRFKKSQRAILYFSILVLFASIFCIMYFSIEKAWFLIPIGILFVFLSIAVIFFRADMHGEVNWVSYKIDDGVVRVIDSEGNDCSDYYDIVYESSFYAMSPEERVRAPIGYAIKPHFCKSCRKNISKSAMFCQFCGASQD